MTIETAWSDRTAEIPEHGLKSTRVASAAEREALARTLGVQAVEHLELRYRIDARAGSRYHLVGHLKARIVQECVVTLEPIVSEIDEPIDLEFWPGAAISPVGPGEHEALSLPEVEPIENDRLAIGRIVFETVAATLDPYPRAPGAELDWQEAAAGQTTQDSPFAALARLKAKPE